jgi:uncharacterized membrane protein
MLSRWRLLLRQFTQQLWVRVALFSLAAVLTALLGVALAPVIPGELPRLIGADALDDILNILASGMLAVTTFSLTTMVMAYTSASSYATPRASRLLMDDPTTQNALGTFIGSFLFSLVSIIALGTEIYGEEGRLVLFVVTLAVILLIVIQLLRWIDYLSRVGRVGQIIDKVEQEARRAITDRIDRPCLGGRPLHDSANDVPVDARIIEASEVGYVQHVDMQALAEVADEHDVDVYVLALPGIFVDRARPLARVWGIAADDALEQIRDAFSIAKHRSFVQDPRFGLCVLAEIASRALSSGVNDPGTAIDVIGRGVRVLSEWRNCDLDQAGESPECPRVWVVPLDTDDLFDDFFQPIARDGAGTVEVHVRLQKALFTLATRGSREMRAAALRHSALALVRAEATLVVEEDKEVLRQSAARLHEATAEPG